MNLKGGISRKIVRSKSAFATLFCLLLGGCYVPQFGLEVGGTSTMSPHGYAESDYSGYTARKFSLIPANPEAGMTLTLFPEYTAHTDSILSYNEVALNAGASSFSQGVMRVAYYMVYRFGTAEVEAMSLENEDWGTKFETSKQTITTLGYAVKVEITGQSGLGWNMVVKKVSIPVEGTYSYSGGSQSETEEFSSILISLGIFYSFL